MKTYDEVFQNVIKGTAIQKRKIRKIQNAVSVTAICAACAAGLSVYMNLEKVPSLPKETETTTTTVSTIIEETMDVSSTAPSASDPVELSTTKPDRVIIPQASSGQDTATEESSEAFFSSVTAVSGAETSESFQNQNVPASSETNISSVSEEKNGTYTENSSSPERNDAQETVPVAVVTQVIPSQTSATTRTTASSASTTKKQTTAAATTTRKTEPADASATTSTRRTEVLTTTNDVSYVVSTTTDHVENGTEYINHTETDAAEAPIQDETTDVEIETMPPETEELTEMVDSSELEPPETFASETDSPAPTEVFTTVTEADTTEETTTTTTTSLISVRVNVSEGNVLYEEIEIEIGGIVIPEDSQSGNPELIFTEITTLPPELRFSEN